jgi:hypothetical protein
VVVGFNSSRWRPVREVFAGYASPFKMEFMCCSIARITATAVFPILGSLI